MARKGSDGFWDEEKVAAALRRAVRAALDRHRRLGNPICVFKRGRVVWLPPETGAAEGG